MLAPQARGLGLLGCPLGRPGGQEDLLLRLKVRPEVFVGEPAHQRGEPVECGRSARDDTPLDPVSHLERDEQQLVVTARKGAQCMASMDGRHLYCRFSGGIGLCRSIPERQPWHQGWTVDSSRANPAERECSGEVGGTGSAHDQPSGHTLRPSTRTAETMCGSRVIFRPRCGESSSSG